MIDKRKKLLTLKGFRQVWIWIVKLGILSVVLNLFFLYTPFFKDREIIVSVWLINLFIIVPLVFVSIIIILITHIFSKKDKKEKKV